MKSPSLTAKDATPRKQVADIVAERIERLIIDGILKVGHPLPSERALCEKLGTSRSALREGLRALRGLGIIETQHGRGSFVARLSADRDASPLMHLFSSQPRTLYDLLEVRAILESEAARLAAQRGTSADFIMIRRRYEEWQGMQTDIDIRSHEELARADHAFHRAINDASHNPVLVHTLQSLSDLMLSSVLASVSNLYHRPVHKRQIDRHHERLYTAVIDRESDKACRIAREHINSLRDTFLELEQEKQRLVRASMRLEADG
ncbi:MAG: transcriptional regulator GlcC [Betaproteobacteria bacterium]|nr:transcriptional regulator GlcC [Betaproteobacteria bacterium]